MELDQTTRELLVNIRTTLLGEGSPSLRIGKVLSLLDGFTKTERGEFTAAAFRNGTPMFVGVLTKWTKFQESARRFDTREAAKARLDEQMKGWQTKHLWKQMTLNNEELRAYLVIEAVK